MKGHLRERSPGHWAIVIELRDPATNKRRRKWHSFADTKRRAQDECARPIAALKEGPTSNPPKSRLPRTWSGGSNICARKLRRRLSSGIAASARQHAAVVRRGAAHQAPTSADFRDVRQGPRQRPQGRHGRPLACQRSLYASALETGSGSP